MPDGRWWIGGAAAAVAMTMSARNSSAQPSTPPEDPMFEAGQLGPTIAPPSTDARDGHAPPVAYEPPAPRFGARGEWVVTGASDVGISSQEFDASQAKFLSVTFSPGLDYFVARNVSIGLTGHVSFSDDQGYGADGSVVDSQTTSWGVGPRVGVNLWLGERFSFYPRLAIGFESVHHDETLVAGSSLSTATSPLGYPTTTQFGPWASLFAPVLFHVKPHLFLGFGPSIFQDFGHAQGGPDVGGQRTEIGAGLVVGGWLGGAAGAHDIESAPPPPDAPRPHRFGLAHQIVIDGGLGLSAYYTGYAGTKSSATSFGFEPGMDYFIADHVSLGLAAALTSSSVTAVDATTNLPVQNTHVFGGAALRLGVDLPLGEWMSIYPRVSLGVGADSWDEKSGSNESKPSDQVVWTSAYLPLLVHPASHFFVGFGPSVARDLDRSIPLSTPQSLPTAVTPTKENRSTTVGAGLIVGGWIDG